MRTQEVTLRILATHPDGSIVDAQVSKRLKKQRQDYYVGLGYAVEFYQKVEDVEVPTWGKPPAKAERQVQKVGPWRIKRWWMPWIVAAMFFAIPIVWLFAAVSSSMSS